MKKKKTESIDRNYLRIDSRRAIGVFRGKLQGEKLSLKDCRLPLVNRHCPGENSSRNDSDLACGTNVEIRSAAQMDREILTCRLNLKKGKK